MSAPQLHVIAPPGQSALSAQVAAFARGLGAVCSCSESARSPDGAVVFDLAEREGQVRGRLYARIGGRAAASGGAVLWRTPPVIEIYRATEAGPPLTLRTARPAFIDAVSATSRRGAVLERLAALVLEAAADPRPKGAALSPGAAPQARSEDLARACARRFARGLARALHGRPQWVIALRRKTDEDILPDPRGAWRILPSPAGTYRADPALVDVDGRTMLFCEEYGFGERRGWIAGVELDAEGRIRREAVVLREPWHLSFPTVIETPAGPRLLVEAGATGEIRLYRPDPDLWRWRHDETLLAPGPYADPLLQYKEGLWWLMFSGGRHSTALYDQTRLFVSSQLSGPWLPHPDDPIRRDARGARPAGPPVRAAGHDLQFGQDCTDGYGRGLVIHATTAADAGCYRETEMAWLRAPSAQGVQGLHAYAQCRRFEAIDLCLRRGPARALMAKGRISL